MLGINNLKKNKETMPFIYDEPAWKNAPNNQQAQSPTDFGINTVR